MSDGEKKILSVLTDILSAIRNENSDEPLSIDQAAEYLNCSRVTIYAMTSNRRIPFFKAGGKLWFKRSDLKQYLLSNRKPSVSELVGIHMSGKN